MSTNPQLIATLALLTAAALTSCNSTPTLQPTTQGRVDSLEYDYAMNVDVTPADTKASLEEKFGGKVVIFQPGQGFATMGFSNQQASAPAMKGNAQLERNKNAFKGGGQTSVFANGRVTAWAGGRVTAWAGGRVTAWAGGNYAPIPENSVAWRQIRLEQGQTLAPNLGAGVKVAVIDTGIDLKHPAFVDTIDEANMWDFVGNDAIPQDEGTLGIGAYGHGTNVAGIILQIAPSSKILPLRVLGADGSGDVTRVAAAINYAVTKGAQVINLSLGSEDKSSTVQKAIDAATASGVLVIASSGNTGDQNVTFPASSAYLDKNAGVYTLSVGSVDSRDVKSTFSTYGTTKQPLELMAPGELIFAPAPDNRMAAWSGTSMAAPMASGALALSMGQKLKIPKSDLMDKLMSNADSVYENGLNDAYKNMLGKGRLNIEQFLKAAVSW
jgi:thermitase